MSKKEGHDPISAAPLSGAQPLPTGQPPRPSDVVFSLDELPSAPRPRAAEPLTLGAIGDRLLRVVWETPLDASESTVAGEMLRALAELLPSCGVGASYFLPPQGGAVPEPRLMRRLPGGALLEERLQGGFPPRIFPELAHEACVSVPGDFGNVTLHVAAPSKSLLDEDSLSLTALRRAILLLARSLEAARTHTGRDADGQAKRVLAAQMVQADKLASLGQIAAGIVHELNNPLTSIVAYSEYLVKRWLARTDAVDPHELERLQRISDSANRLLRFTRDLVTYARPASEAWLPIALHGVINQAVLFCNHLISETKTTIVRSYTEGAPSVRGSPEQLTQVFVNLLTNACQAMGPGGAITVTTDFDESEGVRVVVQDNGQGIAAAHLGQVFSPFFTTKASDRGTGLGLSIVKTIIDAHEGRIWAESEPEQGARFVVVLPRS